MSDAEDDVHVCDICQEIFLGNDELEEHMKEDHAMKEEPAAKEVVFLSTRLISPIVVLSVFVIVSNLIAYPLQSYIANFTHYLLQDPLRWISLRSVL